MVDWIADGRLDCRWWIRKLLTSPLLMDISESRLFTEKLLKRKARRPTQEIFYN